MYKTHYPLSNYNYSFMDPHLNRDEMQNHSWKNVSENPNVASTYTTWEAEAQEKETRQKDLNKIAENLLILQRNKSSKFGKKQSNNTHKQKLRTRNTPETQKHHK